MANELNIALAKSGLTVTAQRYQSGAAVGSAISCPEIGSSGFYSGNMTGTAGTYQVAFIYASANVGSGSIVWSGTAEVPLSTFNATTDAVANVTLCATTTTLTNAPTVPTAAAIASQVRTELATELARVDVATSSRLATSGYTAPSAAPTVTAIRQEMDSNSTKLANLDATVSSRLAGSAYTSASAAPTAADNAAAVRAELATELARVDVATSSRLATSGYTAPSAAPTVTAIRQEMDSNSTKLSNLDASVSSRLASSAYSAAPTTAQIATAVESSLLNEADGQAVLNAIVGAIGNTNVSEVSLVAAVRADLERTGGKIDSIPTTAAPTAAANATAVWGAATKEITGGTVTTLTNAPTVPSAASIASATRSELATELGRLDAAVSTRLATSGYTAPSTAPTAAANASAVRTELATELAKVAALNTDRLANVATTAIVGNLIAQANS